ncbi:uncharacterized protein [Musca autumnalis]|uniref:uncharacterized protein n=1 Tax=Musca autumnalis TaxID=221902 RepID=UPI003CF4B776
MDQLKAHLKQMGVSFPETASAQQLRSLLAEEIAASTLQHTNGQVQPLQQQDLVYVTGEQAQTDKQQQQQANVANSEQAQTDMQQQSLADVPNSKQAQAQPQQQQQRSMSTMQRGDTVNKEKELESRLRALQLEKEIDRMETQNDKKSLMAFAEIEGALPKFTGDDDHDVTKWVDEFERVTNVVGCAEAEKFIYARRLLDGSAKLFMRSAKAESWVALKKELCAEFHKEVGAKEILRKLGNRKWKKGQESLHRYTLEMQELSEGAPITQAELVEFITEGMQDKSMAALVFLNATTVADFKKLIPKYEKMVAERAQKQVKFTAVETVMPEIRCFNCQGIGHYSNVCKKPQRPMRACFKCGRTGHFRMNCPLRAVAAAAEEDELDWNVQPM